MTTRRRAAASSAAVAMLALLTACGAQPATVPTATPFQATPTSGAVLPTATPKPATPVPGAAESNTSSDAPAAPSGDRPYASLSADQRSKIASQPPPLTIDVTKKYVATIITSKGNIVVELDPSAAPQTVNNFIYLSNNGFYDGLTFHRVEPGFVIQGGDPLGNGTGGPGYNVPPEIKLTHVDGAIAMARTGGPAETTPNSGSQFYITMGAQPNLDGQYTSFGKTTQGADVVKQIAIGDKITRIDVVAADGSVASAAPLLPTPAPEVATCDIIPTNIGAVDHIQGNVDAPVTLIEYADLQCPSCAALHPELKKTMDAVSDTVRLVYRHFPLTQIHDKALLAAHAVEAAHLQGKFAEMVDALYTKQATWDKVAVAEFTATVKTIAGELQLDVAKLEADMASPAVIERVQRDIASGTKLNVGGTPTLYVDGQPLPAQAFQDPNIVTQIRDYAKTRVAAAGASTASFSVDTAEQVTEEGALYELTIKTSKGDIVVELDPKLAPVNVNSVVFLAGKGYYDKTPIEANATEIGAVIMGNATKQGNPGYDCGAEGVSSKFTEPGVVAMNPTGAKRNGAQIVFFYNAAERFNGQLTAIGKITAGLDIVKQLQGAQGETKADEIISVTARKK